MSTSKRVHPIRRVREALKTTPEEMGLRQYATGTGFAKFLGRSSSLIRNVECGITTDWRNLADTIQRKTNVSSKWLLSDPEPDDPILDVRCRPWSPSRALDPLRPRKGMPDWRNLVKTCPGVIPGYIAKLVEAQLILELSLGHHNSLELLVSLFSRTETFENPALEESQHKASSLIREGMERMVWRTDHPSDQIDLMLADLLKRGARSLTIEEMQDFLHAGAFGWAAQLSDTTGDGLVAEATRFYAENFPIMSQSEGADLDSDQE